MTDDPRTANPAQLRADIDNGRTGDKVAAPDPAAAPLGTDAEAGGAPPRPEEVQWARAQETAHGEAAREGRAPLAGHGRSLVMPAIVFGACAGFLIVAAVLFA